jgi:AcrR family transcriptional regulator
LVSPIAEKSSSRMSSADRRNQIVAIAAELFSEKGFNGTTTKEIAAHAGVSEAIIFRHFPTKSALYSAIIENKTEQGTIELRQELEQAAVKKDDYTFFKQLAHRMLEGHLKDPTLMRLLLYSALERHELSQIFYQQTARKVRDLVRRYITQRIADGAFRPVNAGICSRAFAGMILYHAEMRILYKDTEADDVRLSIDQLINNIVDLFLHGIRKEQTRPSRKGSGKK